MVVFALGIAGAAGEAEEVKNVNVNGEWDVTSESRRGERTVTMTFVQEGEELTVTWETRRGKGEAKGTVKGNVIEWSYTRKSERGEWTRSYTGTVDGDTMTGEIERGENSTPWKAVRKS